MPITPGRTMARRKRSEHYVNNKEFLAALIKYREDVEMISMYQRWLRDTTRSKNNEPKLSRKMGYISTVNDAKDILEKLYKSKESKG